MTKDVPRNPRRWLSLAMFLVLFLLGASVFAPAQDQRSAMFGSGTWRRLSDWDYDGNRILGHIGYDVYAWDARTGRVLDKFVGHREGITSVQFSPDGKYVLSSSGTSCGELCSFNLPEFQSKDTSTRLWDLKSGKQIWKLDEQIGGVFSPDGSRVLTLQLGAYPDNKGGGIVMWDVATGRQLFSDEAVWGTLAFSPDGRTFLVFRDNSATIYDAMDGREIGRIAQSRAERIESINYYGRDGSIATTGVNGFEIWDSTGQRIHQSPVAGGASWSENSVNWTQDGSRVVAMTAGGNINDKQWPCWVKVWDVDSGETAANANCDRYALYFDSLQVSPDSKRFLISWGGTNVENKEIPPELSLYDLDSGEELAQMCNPGVLLGFSPDSKTFLVGGHASGDAPQALRLNSFIVYSSDSGKPLVTLDLQNERAHEGGPEP